MKKSILLILALVISIITFAQQSGPAASWTETTYDFGSFNEEDGVQSHNFEFVNTGNEALYVTSVKPSCGCTAADYSKEPIPSGGKGFVKVSFDPKNRPNAFNKSVTVTTNELQAPTILRIKGNVVSKDKEPENENNN